MAENDFDLPPEWDAARPIITSFLRSTLNRRTEIDKTLGEFRAHIDARFDQMSGMLIDAAEKQTAQSEVQAAHAEKLADHSAEIERLHNDRRGMVDLNRTMIQEFIGAFSRMVGDTLDEMKARAQRTEILVALLLVGAVGSLFFLYYIGTHLK